MTQEITSGTGVDRGGDLEVGDFSQLPPRPLVSVCVFVYNHGPYVREALDSVLAQRTDFPYELCLGEDGSTDGTREICLEYAQRYPDKIRVLLRDRANPVRQKYKIPFMHNTVDTVQACRGKYVALLDADDYWISENKLSRQAAALESNPACTVAAHYVARIPEGKPWKTYMVPGLPMRELSLESLLRERLYIHTSSLLLRRCEQLNWDVLTNAICGDVPLLFCHLLHGTGIVLPEVMSVYRVNDSGIYTSESALSQVERAAALWETFQPFIPTGLQGLHRAGYIKILADAVAEYRKAGSTKAAFRNFRKALSRVGALEACPWSTRMSLTAEVMGSLLFPRLHGLRQQVARKFRSRRSQRAYDTNRQGSS
jgi:hypothetical protein